jgi:hypothetical protein
LFVATIGYHHPLIILYWISNIALLWQFFDVKYLIGFSKHLLQKTSKRKCQKVAIDFVRFLSQYVTLCHRM